MDVPVLETERLILREHRLDDFDAFATMWGDPDVVRFVGGKPSTLDESWARFLRYVGHWQVLGFGFWAVELREESRYVGDVGFADAVDDRTVP
ncbi:MAG: GNAT family N-acetyltransferase [Vicinamibacterales bacterium]